MGVMNGADSFKADRSLPANGDRDVCNWPCSKGSWDIGHLETRASNVEVVTVGFTFVGWPFPYDCMELAALCGFRGANAMRCHAVST